MSLRDAIDYCLAHVRDGLKPHPPVHIRVQVRRNRHDRLVADCDQLPATVFGGDISSLLCRVVAQLEKVYGEGPYVIEVEQLGSVRYFKPDVRK